MYTANTRRSAKNTPNTTKTKKVAAKEAKASAKYSQHRGGYVHDRLREPLAGVGVTLIQGDSRL